MKTIKMNCEGCYMVHEVRRDEDAPNNAISMSCNWCPNCEETADDYYNEWYNEDDDNNPESAPIPYDPNQLVMPFMIEESLKEKV